MRTYLVHLRNVPAADYEKIALTLFSCARDASGASLQLR